MFLDFQPGSSPLEARQNFPVVVYGIIILLVVAALIIIWLLGKKILSYKNSESYAKKEMLRPTNQKDIKKFAFDYNLKPAYTNTLVNMCKSVDVPNINFLIKNPEALKDIFKDYYFKLKQQNASDKQINSFFELDFAIEKASATTKNLISTKQLVLESVVFYLTQDSEQFPLYLKVNNADFIALEIPKFLYENENLRPPLLEKLRFITKAQNGMTYHFISRAMRYQTNPDGTIYLIIAHTDDLLNQAHRNSKRESIDGVCIFSPAQKIPDQMEEKFKITPKEYSGKLTNISAGGCCIKTNLPIREKQYLAVKITCLDIEEQIVGIIRKTRQLPDSTYNLHIQFINPQIGAKNKINAYTFKYEI